MNELVDVARAFASLALNLLDVSAFELLVTSRSSLALLSEAGLNSLRARAAAMRLPSCAQAAVSVVRRARHVGLSNSLVREAGKKRAEHSPERIAVGLDARDMAALCRLVESLDAVQDAAFKAEGTRSAILHTMVNVLLAHSMPQAGSDAALRISMGDVLLARAAVRAAAAALGNHSSPTTYHCLAAGESRRAGELALRLLRDSLPVYQQTELRAERPELPSLPPPTAAPVLEDQPCRQLLAPGFVPLSPEGCLGAASPKAPRERALDSEAGRCKRPRGPAGKKRAMAKRTALAGVTESACNRRQHEGEGILAYFKQVRPQATTASEAGAC